MFKDENEIFLNLRTRNKIHAKFKNKNILALIFPWENNA
jgi:hypothetical protein